MRSGAHWCDLPERYGRWKTAGAAESATRGDNREVLNYVRALEGAIEGLDALPISSRLIRDTHRTLLTGVARHPGASVEAGGGAQGSGDTQHRWNGSGGELKRDQNWIGGSGRIDSARFIPAPPAETPRALDTLMGSSTARTARTPRR